MSLKLSEQFRIRLARGTARAGLRLDEEDAELISEVESLERDHEIAERVRAKKKWLQDEAARNEWGLEYGEYLDGQLCLINCLLGISEEAKP